MGKRAVSKERGNYTIQRNHPEKPETENITLRYMVSSTAASESALQLKTATESGEENNPITTFSSFQ